MGTYYIPNDSWLEPVDPFITRHVMRGGLIIFADITAIYFTQTMS